MNQLKNSLAWRLTIWFLLLSLLPIGVVTIFTRRTIANELNNLAVEQAHQQAGFLAAQISLLADRNQTQDLLARVSDENYIAFAVDENGLYVAHPDQTKLTGSVSNDFPAEIVKQILSGESGGGVIDQEAGRLIGYSPVKETGLIVVAVEHGLSSSLRLSGIEAAALPQLGISLIIISVLGGIAIWVVMGPIRQLASAAEKIGSDRLEVEIDPTEMEGELKILAIAFKQMTQRLQQQFGGLEQEVAERTRQLQTIIEVSRRLNSILDLSDLMREIVTLVKESFNYYHVHLYLLSTAGDNLLLAEGYGQAGLQMKQQGHHIPLDTPQSLVARAARERRVITVEDIRSNPDWLPNPLLPETRSEVAVPLIWGAEVLGVLDVQSEKMGGISKADEAPLQALADQIAAAVHNARLFTEVEAALADVRAVQRRYISQAWAQTQIAPQSLEHLYVQPEAPALSDTTIAEAEQQAWEHQRPTIVTVNADGSKAKSIVAPVILGDEPIGALQLYQIGSAIEAQSWTEQDLALVEAVLDQVAQTAENLRLFEETREQASFEQLVGEITQKLRQAPSIETLVKTAAEELSRILDTSHALVKVGHMSQGQAAEDQPAHSKHNGKPE